MKRILVPTDFSDEANNALEVAVNLANKVKGSVYLVNVINAPQAIDLNTQGTTSNSGMDQLFMMKLVERVQGDLADLKAKYPDADIETEYVVGEIYSKINEIVETQNMDFIVMGSKGSSGIEEVMIGSNTEKMVRLGKCPVLTVKLGMSNIDMSNIVFASDFKDENAKVVPYLKELQQVFGSKLKLLFINTPNNFEITSDTVSRMEAFALTNDLSNYDVNVYNHIHEEEGIIDFLNAENYDIVAVSTHSRRGLSHLISGSIAEDVVNHTNKSVLTFSLKYL